MSIGRLQTEGDLRRFIGEELKRPDVLQTGSLSGSLLVERTITEERIAFESITNDLIVPGTITGSRIEAGTITGSLIAADTITANNIVFGTITGNRIAASTITGSLIAGETIEAGHLVANTITAGQIAAGTITGAKIAAETIEAGNIKAGTITAGQIAAGTITGTLIAGETIEGKHIKAGTITAGSIEAGSITTALLAAEAVTAAKIKANTIEAGQIKAATITTTEIAAGTIVGGNIAAGTITAGNLSVSKLSAISADLGSITAGSIVGASIKTATAGARVEIDSLGIRGINAGTVQKFNFDVASGILEATAVISAEEGSVIPTKVLTGQITETQIKEGVISTPLLAANSVTAAKISVSKLSAVSVDAGKITAGEIQAAALSVSSLSAISADLGTITAGTITGAIIRTSPIFPKAELNSSGLHLPEGASTEVVPVNKIEWQDESGAAAETIFGHNPDTKTAILYLYANKLHKATGEITMTAEGVGGKSSEHCRLSLRSSEVAEGLNRAEVEAGEAQVILVEKTGASSFVRLGETAKRMLTMKEDVTLMGTSQVSQFLQLSSNRKERDFGIVTSLPASPVVGDRCKYQADKPNGVYWDLVYDGEVNPWKKVGGPPLAASSSVTRTLTNKTAYTSLATDPLKITVPLKGDYDIEIEAEMNQGGETQQVWASYAVGATAANDAWAAHVFIVNGNSILSLPKKTRQLAVAASAVIEEKCRTGGTQTGEWSNRRLWVDPVRVG